jgi:hypothetical protein
VRLMEHMQEGCWQTLCSWAKGGNFRRGRGGVQAETEAEVVCVPGGQQPSWQCMGGGVPGGVGILLSVQNSSLQNRLQQQLSGGFLLCCVVRGPLEQQAEGRGC